MPSRSITRYLLCISPQVHFAQPILLGHDTIAEKFRDMIRAKKGHHYVQDVQRNEKECGGPYDAELLLFKSI